MKTNPYHSHTIAATLIAVIVTSAITGSLVESLNPSDLFPRDVSAQDATSVALYLRDDAGSRQA